MTQIKVEVIPITLAPHPDAESLSIVQYKGWHIVCKTEEFKNVDRAAFVPDGSLMPATPEWEFLKDRDYRVRTIKLRGVLSEGMLVPPRSHWEIGMDVAAELGITKYEPPIPVELEGDMLPAPVGFYKYTDIVSMRDYPNLFAKGEQVIITEKIHGTQVRFGVIDNVFCVGSHAVTWAESETLLYWQVARHYKIEQLLRDAHPDTNVILYGEIFGKKVQDLDYGRKDPLGLALLDLRVSTRYLDFWQLKRFALACNLQLPPILYTGAWSSLCFGHANGADSISGTHMREGIVVRSDREIPHSQAGRKMMKLHSDAYVTRKHGTEFH